MLYPFCLSYSTLLFSAIFEQIFGFNYIKKMLKFLYPKKMLTQEEILLTFNIL